MIDEDRWKYSLEQRKEEHPQLIIEKKGRRSKTAAEREGLIKVR